MENTESGPTQQEIEADARYIICTAIMVTEEFLGQAVSADRLKAINLEGIYIAKLMKPVPFFAFFAGAGAAWVPDTPGYAYKWVYPTEAEKMRLATLLGDLNTGWKYSCRAGLCHLDLKAGEGKLVRRPSDEEIAAIHVRRRAKATLEREIVAVDKRRFLEAGIYPPPERNTPKYITKLKKPASAKQQPLLALTAEPKKSSEDLFGDEAAENTEPTEFFEEEEGEEPAKKKQRSASKRRQPSHHEVLREIRQQLRRKK
jgi:hypothetical protein